MVAVGQKGWRKCSAAAAGHGIIKFGVVNFSNRPRLKVINVGLPAANQALVES